MEEIKKGNIKDLVDIINRTNDSFAYSVYVPSLDKDVLFKEITTAQQKKLVKAVIDSPVFNTEFIFALREIIRENCTEKEIDTDQLTILDKLSIAIKMRAISISNDLSLTVKCSKCEKSHDILIKLDELFDKFKNEVKVESQKILEDERGIYKIYCKIPTIKTEFLLENEFRKNTKIQVNNEKDLRDAMGNIFIGEVVKYIEKIEIANKQNEEVISIDLTNLSFSNRIQLIEQLGTKILNKVITYIADIKAEFEKILLVKMNCTCEEAPELSQRFSIDSSFFIVS